MKVSIKKNGKPLRSVGVSIVALLALQGAFAAPARANLIGDPGLWITMWQTCNTAIAGVLANLPRRTAHRAACARQMGETPPEVIAKDYHDGGIVDGGHHRDKTPDGHAADYASNAAGAEQSGALSP